MAKSAVSATQAARLADLPSVTAILGHPAVRGQPHDLVVDVARATLAHYRSRLLAGEDLDVSTVVDTVRMEVLARQKVHLRRVINATGVVLHTNLGRAPLAAAVANAVAEVARGYANVEMELDSGKRGGRLSTIAALLRQLTGAEDAVVVNNNAAAVLLALTALAQNRDVVVSRGELVEIGGSFRVPDVVRAGGARLVEVGTTNRTRVSDYAQATGPNTALYLRVHPSNFRMEGFTARADRVGLVEAARRHGLQVVEDLGSGLIGAPPVFGDVLHEERVDVAISDGVDLVCFSGDKLLGGPQAGIIVGRRESVAVLRAHPMYRALRLDKLGLVALEATLRLLSTGRAHEIPAQSMLSMSLDECRSRALALAAQLPGSTIEADEGYSGGGALAARPLPSVVVVLPDSRAEALARALRLGTPAVVVRVAGGRVRLDPRTLLPGDVEGVVAAVTMARNVLAAESVAAG